MTMADCPVLVSITNQISQVIQLLINWDHLMLVKEKARINLDVLLQFKLCLNFGLMMLIVNNIGVRFGYPLSAVPLE
jgi:hypothetical protein